MRPWIAAPEHGQWALRESGKQILAYLGRLTTLDLTDEPGVFRVFMVDPHTGRFTTLGAVTGGQIVELPTAQLVWLVRE